MDKLENLRKNIDLLLKKHKLSQTEFARKIELSDGAVSRMIHSNSHLPQKRTLNKISSVFNVDVQDLLSGNLEENSININNYINIPIIQWNQIFDFINQESWIGVNDLITIKKYNSNRFFALRIFNKKAFLNNSIAIVELNNSLYNSCYVIYEITDKICDIYYLQLQNNGFILKSISQDKEHSISSPVLEKIIGVVKEVRTIL
jgi:transcriptional regulator with XRE-family HTH domain